MIYEFFPEEFIQLNREIINHPTLMERLAKHPEFEFEIKLAEIAAYCMIAVDGEFFPEDLKRLAGFCILRLQKMQGVRPLDQVPPAVLKEDDWTKFLQKH